MDDATFKNVLDQQIDRCKEILSNKAAEYSTDYDRLHNFKVAAKLGGGSPRAALAGMMAKHTVSVYDICNMPESTPLEVWNEKITDHINYLILLRALVAEETMECVIGPQEKALNALREKLTGSTSSYPLNSIQSAKFHNTLRNIENQTKDQISEEMENYLRGIFLRTYSSHHVIKAYHDAIRSGIYEEDLVEGSRQSVHVQSDYNNRSAG